jgi:hypothetical protein
MIDHRLTIEFVANKIKESFKLYLFVSWSEDNSRGLSSAVTFSAVPTRMPIG